MDAEHTASPTAATGSQLRLHVGEADRHPEWRLDDETRAVGRRGIAQARAALRSARADHLDDRAARAAGAGGAASSRRRTAA